MFADGSTSGGTIAVIGGGAAGVLAAAHVLTNATNPVDVLIFESGPRLGAGIAYGTDDNTHLLNLPISEMSAFHDSPDDCILWARSVGVAAEPCTFLARKVYREYLSGVVRRAHGQGNRLSGVEWVRAEVVALRAREQDGSRRLILGLTGGGHVEVDEVILALGVPSPALPASLVPWAHLPGVVADPWTPEALGGIGDDAAVLLLGTGLTMVDVALTLSQAGTRRMVARSHHGMLPRPHDHDKRTAADHFGPVLSVRPGGTAREVVRALRQACEKAEYSGVSWQAVVDTFRGEVSELWAQLPMAEQERVLRHAMSYWEIHEHRLAPASAIRLAQLQSRGALNIAKGAIQSVDIDRGRFRVALRRGIGTESVLVDTIVNCTGPQSDFTTRCRLASHLVRTGLARRGPFGLGLEVDALGDLVSSTGDPNPMVHTIGWIRRGAVLETTAIPSLRTQAQELGMRIGRKRW